MPHGTAAARAVQPAHATAGQRSSSTEVHVGASRDAMPNAAHAVIAHRSWERVVVHSF